jgi:Copper type II ascorbate-dependent monooxygenase, C-terminal domain
MKRESVFVLALAGAIGLMGGCSATTSPTGNAGAPGTDSGTTSAPTSDSGATSTQPTGDAAPPAGSYTLQFGPITVAPNYENTQCLTLNLGNSAPIHVGAIHNILGTSSHHMIVYAVAPQPVVSTPFNCQPFTDTLNPADGSVLMVSQKKDDLLTFPQGVAYTLTANQMIRIEMHYINATAAATTLVSTTTLIPTTDYQYEAGFLFIGDPDITLPPMASTTLGPEFFQAPAKYADVNFFAITGHEHKLGTGVTIETATSLSDPGTSIYNVPGWLWSEPATVTSNPPFKLPTNGGFKFTCTWDNTTASTVTFGESATDEMCFFWAYYYPSQGDEVCFHTNQVPGGIDICCPGSPYCSYIQ